MKTLLTFMVSVLFILACNGQEQQIRVNGKIDHAKNNLLVFRKSGSNALTGEREGARYKTTVNGKGEFEIFLPTAAINGWIVEIDDAVKLFDLGGKGNFKITIAVNDDYNITVFDQSGNDFNFRNYAANIVSAKYGYEKLQGLKPLEALAFRKEKAAFQLKLLADYQKNHQMDKNYVAWLSVNYEYEPYERNLVEDQIKPDDAIMALLTEKGINNDFAAMHSENYNRVVKYYVHYKFNNLTFPYKIDQISDFGAKQLSGLTKQVYLTHQIVSLITASDSAYTKLYTKYKNEVTDASLLALVKNKRDKYLQALKESNLSKENISAYSSLNEIFKKYKGKVIYVDFWASWCGPCKSEMPNAARLKEKLKGKNVVFVYLGYRDVKENWLAARKELEIVGEHYLLNDKLITEANSVFEITGIPHYAIIDKDGSMLDKKAARPGNVYQQLLKLAENK